MFQNHGFALAYFLLIPKLCKANPILFSVPQVQSHPSAEAQINEDLIAQPKLVRQNVMLPHDIVHTIHKFPGVFYRIWTGRPGKLEGYWSYNEDLAHELGIQPEET